jgi:hypothetical protein
MMDRSGAWPAYLAALGGQSGQQNRQKAGRGQEGRRPVRREQGCDDPGTDRPGQGNHARRDHESDRLAAAFRPRLQFNPAKKHGIKIEFSKNDAGDRLYKPAE